MGVLYNVLFRNGGGGGMGCVEPASTTTADQPEWVLDRRDGGSLVWRRSGSVSSRHVKFLDEVQVKVYERDEDADFAAADNSDSDGDVDDFLTTSSWSTDTAADDCRLLCGDGKLAADDTDTVVLMMSGTVLGLCIGLAYLFTPVNWLLHQLID